MPPVSGDPTLERLISERPKQLQAQKKLATATVAKDLDFLFGSTPEEGEALEQLEKKVWVLLRLMARKGLITREEFLKELESDE
jgi:hypothetical protein